MQISCFFFLHPVSRSLSLSPPVAVSLSLLLRAEELKEHFSQYGDIESINVKTDPNTGRSRGFAFIVYKSADSIDKVVAVSEHVINNKKVDPKKAKARYGKIFVGGLTSEISDEEIKTFFGQFGNVSGAECRGCGRCLLLYTHTHTKTHLCFVFRRREKALDFYMMIQHLISSASEPM